jgi:hypothetical protein
MGGLGRNADSMYFRYAQISGRAEGINGHPEGYMAFETTSGVTNLTTERMRLNSSGNLGIGTTSPAAKLHIKGDALDNIGLVVIDNDYSSGNVYYPALSVKNTRGNHSFGIISEFRTNTAGDGDRPTILFYSETAAHSWQIGQATSAWAGADSFSIGYRASNDPTTFAGWPTPYFTVGTNGKVGIGIALPSEMLHIKSTSSPEIRLEGAGHSWYIRAYNDNYNVYSPSGRQNVSYLNNGDVRNYNNSTTWQQSSDVRVKENINTISDATSKVLALNPVIYDYKQEFAEKNNWDNDKKINNVGFIAQEFESVFPKYVSNNECVIGETTIDDFKSIDTGHLVAYLVKAIQEQQTIIEDLKSRIETLEG